MGFTTGFTGGVVVTLGAAYLAMRAHQHNRETQSEVVRAQIVLLDNTMSRDTRRRLINEQERQRHLEQAIAQSGRRREPHLVESVKERWNREVESLAHWLQHADWTGTRDAVGGNASREFTELGGEEVVAQATDKAAAAAHNIVVEAKDTSNSISSWLWAQPEDPEKAAEKKAKEEARAVGRAAAEKNREAARLAREKAKEAVQAAEQKAKEIAQITENKATEVVERAKEGGWSLLSRARESVSSAVETLSSAAVGAAEKANEMPVQRALRERYEPPSWLDKSVAQALEERYAWRV